VVRINAIEESKVVINSHTSMQIAEGLPDLVPMVLRRVLGSGR
jgi:hypothetical protein